MISKIRNRGIPSLSLPFISKSPKTVHSQRHAGQGRSLWNGVHRWTRMAQRATSTRGGRKSHRTTRRGDAVHADVTRRAKNMAPMHAGTTPSDSNTCQKQQGNPYTHCSFREQTNLKHTSQTEAPHTKTISKNRFPSY